MRQRFLETIVRFMGGDPELLTQSGVTVIGHPARAENHVTAGYAVGQHVLITCDPAVEQMLTQATGAMGPTLAAWNQVAVDNGGALLGAGRMQVLGERELAEPHLPDGFALRSLDRHLAGDLAIIEHLVESSDEDDLDEAEIDLDTLDDIIEVVLDSAGQIASFASSAGFDMAPNFGDIGIMTRPDSRGLGLGSAAVSALCQRLRAANLEPLYRCDEDNTGSIALSNGLGFTIATQLTAYRFPHR